MSEANRIKSEFLGLSFGAAGNRLRKLIMFRLVQELGKDSCYRCGDKITTVEDFTIDHIAPWLHTSRELFWDLDNIAFSHSKCNRQHRTNADRTHCKRGHEFSPDNTCLWRGERSCRACDRGRCHRDNRAETRRRKRNPG